MSNDEIRLQIVLALIAEGPTNKASLIEAAQMIAAFVFDEPPSLTCR